MVRKTINHIFRCSECFTAISDEGEIICKEAGCIFINNAFNVLLQESVLAGAGLEMQPVLCAGCHHLVGYQFEKNELFPSHLHKIVLCTELVTMWTDEDVQFKPMLPFGFEDV